jgi:arylsulfatase A-like enzyme
MQDPNALFICCSIRTNRQHYRAAVSWTDYLVGEVMKELDTQKFDQNTVVSFLGDHVSET